MERNIWSHESESRIGSTDGIHTWDTNGREVTRLYGDQLFEVGTDRFLGRWYGNHFYGPGDEQLLEQHGNITYNPNTWGKISELY